MLRLSPQAWSASAAAISERGIAAALISAARQSARNTRSTITTSTPPKARACMTLPVATSTKLAGRNRSARRATCSRSRIGRNSSRAASRRAVTARVSTPTWAPTISSTPGLPSTRAALIAGSGAAVTVATSDSTTLAPPSLWSTARPSASGVSDWPSLRSRTRWFGVSTKPAPRTPVAFRAAARTSLRPIWKRIRSSGRTWTCSARTAPP